MPENPAGSEKKRTPPGDDSAAQFYEEKLRELRAVLETSWNDKTKVTGLLLDAELKTTDYSLDGGANTIWANLIPVLKSRGELSAVLKVLIDRVGQRLNQTVVELYSYFAGQEQKAIEDSAYPLMAFRLRNDFEAALVLLRQALNYDTALLMPSHPTAARMAGMRAWITGCVKAIARAQSSGIPVSSEDQAAQTAQIAEQIAAVSDAFRSYATLLERSRSADEGDYRHMRRSLADVDEEETLLLNRRRILRDSVQQLIGTLRTENLLSAGGYREADRRG